nr:hypothetical protein [Tanacetum cinerariifolium]
MTRLAVGRKDDKEEAATKVFDMMIRNTSPKVGETTHEEGLSTFKRSGAGEREAHKIGKSTFKGGVMSLKVYNEEE